MRGAAHLSSRGRVPSLRPLVAVAVASVAARSSRNVRISCTLMPYHHKAPQHECARHARSRIVARSACRRKRRWAGGARRRAALLTACLRDGRGGTARTRARPAALRRPYSHLATTYLDIINKIIVRHELVR